jgi:hypothetical protein
MKVETSKIHYDNIVSNSGDFFGKCLFIYSFFKPIFTPKWEFVTDYSSSFSKCSSLRKKIYKINIIL